MKKYIKSTMKLPEIKVTLYIKPIIYMDSDIFSSLKLVYDKEKHRKVWKSDNNPSRIINGPLSGPGEELEQPIRDEYERFLQDCDFVIKDTGFTIIDKKRSTESKKSEYLLLFGIDDTPYGRLVFDFRISDHTLDKYEFPEGWKDVALKYLKMNKILDSDFEKHRIDFMVDKVLVGNVADDTWNKALNRLYDRLLKLRLRIRKRMKAENKLDDDNE